MMFHFKPVSPQAVAVYLPSDELVGHFKLIGTVWKFKAVGCDQGHLIPGGGPLTHRHNVTVARRDEAAFSAALLGSS